MPLPCPGCALCTVLSKNLPAGWGPVSYTHLEKMNGLINALSVALTILFGLLLVYALVMMIVPQPVSYTHLGEPFRPMVSTSISGSSFSAL